MTVTAVLVLLAVIPFVVTIRAAGARRRVLADRRATVLALRCLQAVVEDCQGAPPEEVVDRIARGLSDLLRLLGCRFEPVAPPDGLPVLGADGGLDTLVQRRLRTGVVLPERVALPVGPGRFVLLGDPRVGTTPEERIIAVVLAGLVAAVMPATTPR